MNTEYDVAVWANAKWYEREAKRLGYAPDPKFPGTSGDMWFSPISVPCFAVDARDACLANGIKH